MKQNKRRDNGNTTTQIKELRLEWFVHIMRRTHTETIEKIKKVL